MTVRLTLICCGATAATRSAAFPRDEPLEDKAAAQAAGLAAAIRAPGRLLCSPAQAARQTAQALGLAPDIASDLRDADYGDWAGLALDQIEPAKLAAWLTDPAFVPPGGEAVTDVLARIGGWMNALTADSGAVLAITHAACIRAAILSALDAPAAAFWRLDIAPLSMTQLSFDGRRWQWRAALPPLS